MLSKEFKNPKVRNYKKLTPIDHILKRPGMYCTSLARCKKFDWVYSFETQKMEKKNLFLSGGAERMFWETISNAYDNKIRSESESTPFTNITVTMNNSTVSVKNDGASIPIALAEDEFGNKLEYYIPEMIFGQLLTSSNYDDDEEEERLDCVTNELVRGKKRVSSGLNGLGEKVVNVLSKLFTIIIHNHESGLRYTQTWKNNMKEKNEPEIINLKDIKGYKGKTSTVEIIYELDFKRFGYDEPTVIGDPLNGEEMVGGYDLELFQLFARHCISISWNARVPVKFNNLTFNVKNIKEFAKFYFGDAVRNSFIYYEWPENTELKMTKHNYRIAVDKKVMPLAEVLLLDTPDSPEQLSYVNSMITRDGGTHVNAVWSKVSKGIIKIVNDKINQKKGANKNVKITLNDIKPHVSMITSFIKVENPEFESQSKTKLSVPDQKFFGKMVNIVKESYQIIDSWMLYTRLLAIFDVKSDMLLKTTDGKFTKHLGKDIKVVEANYAADANTEERLKTMFYICEGDSASIYLDTKISCLSTGRDYIGYMPARGKGLNMFNATIKQLLENKEILCIKKYLGLIEGTDYSIEANYLKLRYGKVCILADSDDDGCHIVALITLYFFHSFPSLLRRGFLYYEKTPLVRLTKGKEELKFYISNDYEKWKEENDTKGWKAEYFKGLATSANKHVSDDCRNPIIMQLVYDENCQYSIELVFKKQNADGRKVWITERNIERVDLINTKTHNVSGFINSQLINYSVATITRAIPKLMDGLKVSQRKILYAAFLHWKISKNKTSYKEFKVAQFQGFIATNTAYPHGEQNLEGTIIKMARNFPGTNNISLLKAIGQFGSRINADKKPSGRYVHTVPRTILSYIFKEEDNGLLDHLYDDDDKIEPKTYLPIIPTILVNGGRGISTGWNTFVPNFNPLQIIDWISQRLSNTPADEITHVNPWYFGHKGVIKLIDRRNKKKRNGKVKVITIKGDKEIIQETNDVFNEECKEFEGYSEDNTEDTTETSESDNSVNDNALEEKAPKEERQLLTMISYGSYYQQDDKIIITELPIGVWSKNYEDEIDVLISKKRIKGKYSKCTQENVYIEIEGFQGPVNHKTLGLVRAFGMSNMVLLDENNVPVRHDTQYDILENFFEQRLPFYYKRKELILEQIKSRCSFLLNKMKFIKLKIDGFIVIDKKKYADIVKNILEQGIDKEYVDDLLKIPVGSFSEEKVAKLDLEIVELKEKLEMFKILNPEELWKTDLEELREQYLKFYKEELKDFQIEQVGEKSENNSKKRKKYQRKKKVNVA